MQLPQLIKMGDKMGAKTDDKTDDKIGATSDNKIDT